MRSAQKIVPGGNVINIPSRTQIKELYKNLELVLLILFSLFHPSYIPFSGFKRLSALTSHQFPETSVHKN